MILYDIIVFILYVDSMYIYIYYTTSTGLPEAPTWPQLIEFTIKVISKRAQNLALPGYPFCGGPEVNNPR